jgi:hypothetical protein
MPLVPLKALLWRRVNNATFQTLNDLSPGQYDIRLTKNPDIAKFFSDLPTHAPTSLGGYTIDVSLEPFDGPDPVPATTLQVRFMGEDSERADWYIRSQRRETAYPLWRPTRGVPSTFNASRRDFVVLLRDTAGNFHARFIHEESFAKLPNDVQSALLGKQLGVKEWQT